MQAGQSADKLRWPCKITYSEPEVSLYEFSLCSIASTVNRSSKRVLRPELIMWISVESLKFVFRFVFWNFIPSVFGFFQFLEGMQLKYDEDAKKKGVYIVGSCGFDSIPSEMGIAFLKQNFADGGICFERPYFSSILCK